MANRKLITMLGIMFIGVGSTAWAQTQIVDLGSSSVTEVQPANQTLGKYYVLAVRIPDPPANAELMDAHLEFYFDAASRRTSDLSGDMVTLGVFPLKAPLTGEVDDSKIRSGSMKRSVFVGDGRRVRININEFVRDILANPGQNHGLVVGSISGDRMGSFDLKSGSISKGVLARLTLLYKPLNP